MLVGPLSPLPLFYIRRVVNQCSLPTGWLLPFFLMRDWFLQVRSPTIQLNFQLKVLMRFSRLLCNNDILLTFSVICNWAMWTFFFFFFQISQFWQIHKENLLKVTEILRGRQWAHISKTFYTNDQCRSLRNGFIIRKKFWAIISDSYYLEFTSKNFYMIITTDWKFFIYNYIFGILVG